MNLHTPVCVYCAAYGRRETLAFRQFIGTEGLAFESAAYSTGEVKTLTAGCTQYNLFGNGSYATLEASSQWTPYQTSPSVSATVGIPLTAGLTLVLTPQWTNFGSGPFSTLDNQIEGSVGLAAGAGAGGGGPAVVRVAFDRDLLRQVLVNLCDNSSLAMAGRAGTVTVTARR